MTVSFTSLKVAHYRLQAAADLSAAMIWYTMGEEDRALTRQGTLIIVAVHNRAGGKGPSLNELAQVMQRLGVVDGLNFDGGSSTSLALGGQLIDRSPVTAARVHNGLGIFVRP